MEYVNLVFEEVYKILFLLVPVLVSVAMIVWLDRRVWAFVQKRQGPNVVGPFGLLQTIADALKYIFKEIIIPASSNKVIFILAPIITMTLALIAWAVIPFGVDQVLADINVGILYIFAVSSLLRSLMIAGTLSIPASWAALHLLSPTTISNLPEAKRLTTSGCNTPCSLMLCESSSRVDLCIFVRG